ncbi:hypothetical protein J3D54_005509 [Pseudomonas sp. GGS8]|nr:hypothetical protein [Pseudomonas sp. GGS8]
MAAITVTFTAIVVAFDTMVPDGFAGVIAAQACATADVVAAQACATADVVAAQTFTATIAADTTGMAGTIMAAAATVTAAIASTVTTATATAITATLRVGRAHDGQFSGQ